MSIATVFQNLFHGRPVTDRPAAAPAGQARPTAAPAFGADTLATTGRQARYKLVVDLVACRICVVDKATDKPVARYLTSPGTADHPTSGTRFTIDRTLVKAAWNPPSSSWAKGLKPVPGGPENPMGIFKMSLGQYNQYIHGTPAKARKDLGRPASHGCLRMSNENVLQLYQRYAGVGSEVTVVRDAAASAALQASFKKARIKDHAITDGAELLPDALAGTRPTPWP